MAEPVSMLFWGERLVGRRTMYKMGFRLGRGSFDWGVLADCNIPTHEYIAHYLPAPLQDYFRHL